VGMQVEGRCMCCIFVSSFCFQIPESCATWSTSIKQIKEEGERIEKGVKQKQYSAILKNNSICTTALKGKKKSNNQLMSCRETLKFHMKKSKIVELSLYIAPTSKGGVGPLYIG